MNNPHSTDDSQDLEKKNESTKEDDNTAEAELESTVIPSKKVLYLEIDDEVTAAYDKIRPLKVKNIYLVIPKRAVIFQSIVNLKILKKKAENEGKTINFITSDQNGIYLAGRLGIPVFDKLTPEGKSSLFSVEKEDERLRITPLKASVNAATEETPTRLSEKKISISELLKLRRGSKKVTVSPLSPQKEKPKESERNKFVIVAPNRHALISLIVVSLIILLVVTYVALPSATIYLTPSASVLEQSTNITLADYDRNKAELNLHPKHIIASYPIETTVEKVLTHKATSKKFSEKGASASGMITIVNTTSTAWPLIVDTRFQDKDGIVFRIKDAVTVPAATTAGPGKIDAYVVADELDAYNQVVGARGNIGPTKFFLPGLKDDSKDKLYGESAAEMKGGVTDFVTYISEEDITAAQSRIRDELIKNAIAELDAAVAKKAELTGENIEYVLLKGEGAVIVGEPTIEIPPNLVGQELSEFTVSGKVHVEGVYYNRQEMVEILKAELMLKKSPQKELLRVNEESTSYRIYEWDDATGKIKLTVNIKGIEQYEIDYEKENSQKLLQKIRDHVVGKSLDEAKDYIQNLPEINKVEIESWPMWSPTIPSLKDNIEFEVREAITVEE